MPPTAETTPLRNASPSGTARPDGEFAARHKEYARKLSPWVAANCGSPNDVDDICQQVWIRVFRSLASFDPTTNFFAWLLAIARNVIIDFYRRRKVKRRNAEEFGEDYDHQDPRALPPEDFAMQHEQAQVLAECVTKLPEQQQDLFNCLMSGGTVPTCAEQLDMPVSSAYLEKQKAIASLKFCVERNPS